MKGGYRHRVTNERSRCHGSGVSDACNCDAGVSSLVTSCDHVTPCHASHARPPGRGAPGPGDIGGTGVRKIIKYKCFKYHASDASSSANILHLDLL